MDEDFAGVEEADGEYKLTEASEGDEPRRPFKAFLDVGLHRTSTGARIFGAMKGASDGGILIPHSENRFPGYDMETKELDAETLRKYIFGGHVAEYMETLADDDEERYKSQFQGYIDDEIEADGLEELYQEAHKQIREDPFKKVEEAGEKKTKEEWKKEALKYRGPQVDQGGEDGESQGQDCRTQSLGFCVARFFVLQNQKWLLGAWHRVEIMRSSDEWPEISLNANNSQSQNYQFLPEMPGKISEVKVPA